MTDRTYKAGFLFCGLGAGALGFLEGAASLGSYRAQFRSVGGIDLNPEACADFEMLTGSPAVQADLSKMQPRELKQAWGPRAPVPSWTEPFDSPFDAQPRECRTGSTAATLIPAVYSSRSPTSGPR